MSVTSFELTGLRYPATAAQRSLWFHASLHPASCAYINACAIRLTGNLDVSSLTRAVDHIVLRHETLRTRFEPGPDGTLLSIVSPDIRLDVPIADLRSESASDRAQLERAHIEAAARVPFDLAKGPLIRVHLLRLAEDRWSLLVAVHHIVFDRWSFGIFMTELAAFYRAARKEHTAPLPLATQYADHARTEARGSDAMERDLAFWLESDIGAVPPLELPLDAPRPAIASCRGAVHECTLDAELTRRVTAAGRSAGATPFMVYLSAFAVLLQRVAGQNDIVLGIPVAGRLRPEVEALIGLFVNTLPLRLHLTADAPFSALLRDVRQRALTCLSHQAAPLERIVRQATSSRDASRHPLFDVIFNFHNTPQAPVQWPDRLRVETEDVDVAGSRLDLSLTIRPQFDGSALCRFEYATDLFRAATIERLALRFREVLDASTRTPDLPVSRLAVALKIEPVADATDSGEIAVLDGKHHIHTAFSDRALSDPEHIAVIDGRTAVTYGELERRSNQLAHYLRSLGVVHGSAVGVALERSVEMVLVFLAILKAGGTYVPIDPEYPPQRVAQMLADSAVSIVVTTSALGETFASHERLRVVDIDRSASHVNGFSETAPVATGTAADVAYILYTSGSTGVPKGVVIPHRGVLRLVIDTNYLNVGPADTVAQGATVSFDASTIEIWGALLNGARLAIVETAVLIDPPALMQAIAAASISVLFLTTSLFIEVARAAPMAFRPLRYLLVGGEPIDPGAVRSVFGAGPPLHFLNVYGPTEATALASTYEIVSCPASGEIIPIGQAISGTQLYVLDDRLSPVGDGEMGQLFIGGCGLAIGYLNDAALTQQRFIQRAAPDGSVSRLYATGDLVRRAAGGDVEFAGRIDAQMKIRGFRIEPGEIELRLCEVPHINEARVLIRGNGTAARLVAYVRRDSAAPIDRDAILAHLRTRLPAYLLPSAIVEISAFPLTRSGKLDAAALPEPEPDAEPGTFLAPRHELEQHLTRIWERLLDVRPVGIRDDFFRLGGHSLLAARMVTEVERTFGKRIPLTVLFEQPTVERIARALLDEADAPDRLPVVRLHADGALPPLFFFHGSLEGGGVYCHALAAALGADQPLYLMRPHGIDDDCALGSIVEMAAGYVDIMKEAQPHGPYRVGGYCSGGLVALEVAASLRAGGDVVAHVILLDAPAPVPAARTAARATDSIARMMQLHPSRRTRLVNHVARLPFTLRRLRRSESKIAFLRNLARRNSTTSRSLIGEWMRVSETHIASAYQGSVTVLVSEAMRDRRRRSGSAWSAILTGARVIAIPGDHYGCVTEFVADAARQMRTALTSAL